MAYTALSSFTTSRNNVSRSNYYRAHRNSINLPYTHRRHLCTRLTPSASLPSPIAVIGASGKMATALITGILAADNPPRIIASSRSRANMSHLPIPDEDKLENNVSAITKAEMVLVSVKPKYAAAVFQEIAPLLRKRAKENKTASPIVVSVIAGFTTSMIRALLGDTGATIPVVRTMPNIPSAIGAGCTSICQDEHTPENAIVATESVLRCVGSVERVTEDLFPATTALAGSGVAYLFMAAEAMADAAVKHGLDRKTAMRMAASTVYGAGALLMQGKHPAVLRNEVESPGGVTVAATSTLEEEGFRSALGCAMDAAVERNVEMEEEEEG